jgi:RNA polymerase sigma-70 factor (ECF subfamily)
MTGDRLRRAADALNQGVARRVEGGEAAAFQAVLSAAARGDEDAFGALWHRVQPALLRYFRVAVPAAAAEDLASETWLAVVRGLDRFSGDEAAFRAWVFTIARHEVLAWRRRAARPATETPTEQTTPDLSPTTSSRTMLALIDTLPPDQAEVVVLRIVGGLDVAEVAKITGKRPGTVRMLTHRALRRLAMQVDPTAGGGRQDHDLAGRKAVPVEGSSDLGPEDEGPGPDQAR